MSFCKLTDDQLDKKMDFLYKYMDKGSNAATASFLDPNANIEHKNVATMVAELNKDVNVQVNRRIIHDILSENHGVDFADEYYNDLKNHRIYSHDETNIQPYCCSVSMYPFLLKGTKNIAGVSNSPKHLNSFCGSFINFCFQLAAQFAGAVATPEFLLYFDYYARKDYGEEYLEKHPKIVDAHLQQVVYSMNQPAASRSYQSAFWNISIFDENFFYGMFDNYYFPDGYKASWRRLDQIQRYFMTWFNKEREVAVLTFPVVTAAILSENKKPKDEKTVDFLCKEMSEGNSFFIYQSDTVDSLSSCCRLRNAIDKNEFSFTLGAGGIKTGSKKVISINANRLVQQSPDWKIILHYQINRIHKYLLAYEKLFKDFYDAGMLPIYSAGYIGLNDQYLTIGVNGLVEAAEFLGIKPNNNEEYFQFLQEFLKIISDLNKEAAKKHGVKFNTEFVPGESLGVKNSKWDKQDELSSPRPCYNSYFYPVEDNTISIIDKFRLHGDRVLQYLDGGSALHLNLEDYPSKEGYRKIIELAMKTGCNYFTTNVMVTICEKCNYIDKKTLDACRKCGNKDVSHATRIIGYLKEIKKFSKDRQIEAADRFYAGVNEIKDNENEED